MIILSSTTQSLDVQVITSISSFNLDVETDFVDITTTTFTGSGAASSVSATIATLVDAPAASTQRQVKYLSVFNVDSIAHDVYIYRNTSGTRRVLFGCTLQSSEKFAYCEGVWTIYTSLGVPKTFTTGGTIEGPDSQLIYKSPLTSFAGALTTGATGYWVYMGRTLTALVPRFVEFQVSVAGAGAQTAEVGLFSTPGAPDRAGKTLTKIEATGTVSALTGTGVMRNTNAFSTTVSAGTHLWAGYRVDMATTEPTVIGLCGDFAEGFIQSAAAPGALTGAGPFTGSIVAAGTALAWQCPDLRVVL